MCKLKLYITCILFWGATLSSFSQNIEDLSFGTDSTLEVITWNLENFPKEDQTTMDYVSQIVTALDADIIALQEIYDLYLFNQMLEDLDGYSGFIVPGNYTDLAYIYKSSSVEINDIYEIYTSSAYWTPFPRPPLVIDFNFKGYNFFVINNHLKCCGDGVMDPGDPDDEETRRFRANNLIKQYIDEYFPDKMVFIVGDMNDELTDEASDNVFRIMLEDPDNYLYADYEIATGNSNNWSYPTWPSHLDHIAITNDLFPAFENEGSGIQVLKIEESIPGGWWEYDDNISDHRPVAIKLSLPADLGIGGPAAAAAGRLVCYPNPMNQATTITLPSYSGSAEISISNIHGQIIYKETLQKNQKSISLDTKSIREGIYFARLLVNNSLAASTKLVVVR
ncbi:MAG: endonuclease/exonuclease/phosphatase family protein [Bacteroidales bacterium]|nr:endonuclease/exonuclease/phosphatase family protein [Bacteroidales bacterium]